MLTVAPAIGPPAANTMPRKVVVGKWLQSARTETPRRSDPIHRQTIHTGALLFRKRKGGRLKF
jgi:hypothetical protein